MADRKGKAPDDLMLVAQLAEEFKLSEPTVWNYLRRHDVPRYRIPAMGKRTLVSRADFARIMHTPVPVDMGKAAA